MNQRENQLKDDILRIREMRRTLDSISRPTAMRLTNAIGKAQTELNILEASLINMLGVEVAKGFD